MTPDRKKLLDELGFVWEVRNRQEWGDRYQQLLEYKEKNGTTVRLDAKVYINQAHMMTTYTALYYYWCSVFLNFMRKIVVWAR